MSRDDPFPGDDPLAVALRRALDQEAQAVEPDRDGLARIRAAIRRDAGSGRFERGPARGAWFGLPVLAAAAAVVVAAVGTAVLVRPDPAPAPPGVGGTGTPATSTGPERPAAPALPVYYPAPVGSSYRLYREFHPTTATRPVERAQQAVSQAMSRTPDDPDYVVLWAEGADARVGLADDRITITLNQAAAGGTSVPGGSEQGTAADAFALQQLVWTATAAAASTGAPAPAEVQMEAEGPTPDRFGSVDLAQPLRRNAPPGPADPLSVVQVDSLGQDARVQTGRITVSGQAVGGSAATWVLRSGATVVGRGTLRPRAPDGGELGPGRHGVWSLELTVDRPGRYTLTVSQDRTGDLPAGQDSRDFTAGSG